MRTFLFIWLPCLLYFAFILLGSLFLPVSVQLPLQHLDKLIHFGEYFVLAFLASRVVRSCAWPRPAWLLGLVTWLCVSACGALDEVSQMVNPHRTPDLLDFAADALGAFVCVAIYWSYWSWSQKRGR